MRFVFKFGGSSLDSAEKILSVAKFIKSQRDKGAQLAVVVSAMGKTTNKLEELAKSLSPAPKRELLAELLTMGESISVRALAIALEGLGVRAQCFGAGDIKIHARGDPLMAVITHVDKAALESALHSSVAIVAGFQGINERGKLVTLGRGGSDTTAVALGVVLGAKVKIFTDVDGFYDVDPSEFAASKAKKEIGIGSALELSAAGAKVLDCRCLELANKFKTPLEVLESGAASGTRVCFDSFESFKVDGISYKNKIVFVKNNTNFAKNDILINNNILFEEWQGGEHLAVFEQSCGIEGAQAAQLVVIAGSGFSFFKSFKVKVCEALDELNISPLFLSIDQTRAKIVIKNGAKRLVEVLREKLL